MVRDKRCVKIKKNKLRSFIRIGIGILLIFSVIQVLPFEVPIIEKVTASSTWFETDWSAPNDYTDSSDVDTNSSAGNVKLVYGQWLYVADHSSWRIVKTMINGSGWTTYGIWSPPERMCQGPAGIFYNKNTEDIYVTASITSRIIKTKMNGSGWTSYRGPGYVPGQYFSYPTGISFDSDTGYIYVANTGHDDIVKTMMNGSGWTTYGSKGSGTGQFLWLCGLHYDKDTGYIYASDCTNYRIVKTKMDGSGWTTFGSSGSGEGQFNRPWGINYDNTTGYIYVADEYNSRIVKTKMDGSGWTTYGSPGSGKGQFSSPKGIRYDSGTGYIYVADYLNDRIVKTKMDGTGWTTYGSGGSSGKGQFSDPYDISIGDCSYVSDGYLISKQYDCGAHSNFETINWVGTAPQNTSIKFQLRTGAKLSNLTSGEFVGPDGTNGTYYTTSGANIWSGHNGDRWVQYKLNLSTTEPTRSPILRDVTIIYNLLPNRPVLTAPGNNTHTNNSIITFTWSFIDADSNSQSAFQWQMDNDRRFTNIDYDSKKVISSTSSFTPSTSLSDGSWYWRVRTQDSDLGWGANSLPWKIIIDTTPPQSTLTLPVNNEFNNNLAAITGTASEPNLGTGINRVEITIKRFGDDHYWDGSKWCSAKAWLLCSGTTDWFYDSSPVSWTSGMRYIIHSRAVDNVTNVEHPSSGIIFNFDSDKPTSSIENPADNCWLNTLNNISGSSTDTGGAGVKKVEISIIRPNDPNEANDANYWDGAIWRPTEYWLPVNGTYKWEFDTSLIPWLSGNQYVVESRAIDNATNIETAGTGNGFRFDLDNPFSTIERPADNAAVRYLDTISGHASDIGGSGIDIVEISIKQNKDNSYWDGRGWCQEICWLLTTGEKNWQDWYYDAINVPWITDTDHIICTRATDNVGNTKISWPGNTFMYDDTPPEISISINNGDEYSSSESVELSLTAEDGGSGVSLMAFSIDGVDWTSWESFDHDKNFTLPSDDGEKKVYFKVQDRLGNMATPVFDTIILDTTPAEATIVINDNATYTNSEHVALSLRANDTESGVTNMAFSFNSATWTAREPFDLRKYLTLPSGDGEKIVYFEVADHVGNIAYANDSITLDTTPPHSLSIIITDVVSNASASSTVVTLTLNAIDATSGVHQMSFRTDGSAWCAWEEYDDMAYYTLPTTGDKHTIYFMVKDRAGNTADPVSAICYMNTTSPEPEDHRPDKSKSSINVSMSYILWLIIFTIIIILSLVVLKTSRSKRSKRELRTVEVGTKPIGAPALAKLQPATTPRPTLAQPPGTTADGAQPAQGTTTPIPKLASPKTVGKTPTTQQIPQPTKPPQLPPTTQTQTTKSESKKA